MKENAVWLTDRSPWDRLFVAGKTGWIVGFILGSFDLVARLVHGTYEWFELYLALFLPALSLSVIQMILTGLILVLYPKFFRSPYLRSIQLSLCLVALAAFAIRVQTILREAELGKLEFFSLAADLLVSVCILYSIFQLGTPKAQAAFQKWRVRSQIVRVGKLAILCVNFMLFSCITMDCYLMFGPVSRAPEKMSSSSRPHVILITLDTLRARSLSIYGYERNTSPHLSAFAKEAITFTSAYSPTSWTLPSHASLFTGKWIHQHGADTRHQQLDESHTTIAEVLRSEGYETVGIVAGPYVKSRYGLAQGFDQYLDRLDYFEYHTLYERFSIRRLFDALAPKLTRWLLGADGEKSAEEVNAQVFKRIERSDSHPIFLFLNYFDTHDPYDRGEVSSEHDDNAFSAGPDFANSLVLKLYYDALARTIPYPYDESLRSLFLALYDAEVKYLDDQLGELFRKLKENSLWENSWIIITSDHGEEFFEHGGLQHRQTLYREVLHVPLLIKPPVSWKGKRVGVLKQPVSLVQIFPSLMRALHLSEKLPKDLPITPDLFEDETHSDFRLFFRLLGIPRYGGTDMNAILVNEMMFIDVEHPAARIPDALFDHSVDPLEKENLLRSAQESHAELLGLLHSELEAIREEDGQ